MLCSQKLVNPFINIPSWLFCCTCDVFVVNKGALSSHCVALGQVCFSAAGFLVFWVVSGCQTQYSSRQLLEVGTLISCDSVFLSFKKQLHDGVGVDSLCLLVSWASFCSCLAKNSSKKYYLDYIFFNLHVWRFAYLVMLTEGEKKGTRTSLRLQQLNLQSSKVRSLDSRGSPEQREVVCVNSVFTCSDRWTNYSKCLPRSTDNQVFSLSAAYSHSGGQTHISLLSRLISVSLSVSAFSSLHSTNSISHTHTLCIPK